MIFNTQIVTFKFWGFPQDSCNFSFCILMSQKRMPFFFNLNVKGIRINFGKKFKYPKRTANANSSMILYYNNTFVNLDQDQDQI